MDEAPGAGKERIETYLTYFEGVPQLATPRFAKNAGGAAGYAGWQAGAAHKS
ncbi:hypothetical protein HYS85_01465 [Candidatus Saccharibacteria bacterium]|nr:hypothetical protein [Candidatus Saccharibacteria bacterium]